MQLYLVGFACIEGVVGLFTLINGLMCLRKCKGKVCPAKKSKEKKKLNQNSTDSSEIEMEEQKKKGPKYNQHL